MSALTTSLQFGLGGAWLAEHTLRTVGAGLAIFDKLARLSQCDERAAQLLGLSGDPLPLTLDDPRWSPIHLDGRELTAATDPIRASLTLQSSSVAEVVGVATPDEDTRWLAVTALPLPGLDGTTQASLASMIDVTGIVRDRAAVDLAELLGRSAFDHSTTPMCVADVSGRIVDWNRAFAERVDRPDYELMATPLERWISSERALYEDDASGNVSVIPARWVDDRSRVVVRAWRADRGPGGRTMIELAPPAWQTAASDAG